MNVQRYMFCRLSSMTSILAMVSLEFRQHQGECAAFSRSVAVHADVAAEHGREFFADGKPEAGAFVTPGGPGIDLLERPEKFFPVLGPDPDPRVRYRNLQHRIIAGLFIRLIGPGAARY